MLRAERTTGDDRFAALNKRFAGATPEEILTWAGKEFSPDLSLACSFGGASGMVLLDMVAKLRVDLEVFYLDTELLFPETYALRDEAARRYGIQPVGYRSRLSLAEQADKHGAELWRADPDRCCYLRKIAPNEEALRGKRAWISGIRRDQSDTRASIPPVQWDDTFGLVKLCPLVSWTEEQVHIYVAEHHVPVNELHAKGYPSIGCTPCTRPVMPGESSRAGRWAGSSKTECGLHLPRKLAALA
ncbi:MAG TPA: phosphoadenylyl-sulfate reductase [Chloroflexota bacterium]|nr:phosphoadenylyl-sulfate reductase [Chloroflexota bacterium]